MFRLCQIVIRRGFATQSIKCWKCQTNVPLGNGTTFCSSCKSIQPLGSNINYFSYLDVEKNFKIDEKELQKKFHSIQSNVHPDKFSGKESNEKDLSEKHSRYLNEAYNTLKNPRKRAVYLLEHLTGSSVEEPTDDAMAKDMFDFMQKVDSVNEPKAIEELGAEIGLEVSNLMKEVEECFNKSDTKKAKSLLNRLRYYERAQKILEKKMQ
ncbi:Iron-sulfur cluster co-chaperone protein HscB, mitochondrial [Aphelenchoides bicaudatus]|nr:Iron-sulfur cluster co-chaperone protein HscB, mitochondrial [Aphelenchoides bicaudatus]